MRVEGFAHENRSDNKRPNVNIFLSPSTNRWVVILKIFFVSINLDVIA